MNYKGIVLAGGYGKRLYPVTKVVNKHFLPIYDKPLIFYSLSVLLLSKIRDILIICSDKDLKNYIDLLGDGSRFGIKLNYKIQNKPGGIPEAFIIGEKFINKTNVALILGDNMFYGHKLMDKFAKAKLKKNFCTIFLYPVKNPSEYGVVEIDNKNKIKYIKEKPKKTKSNLAISGFYLFDKNVSAYAKKLKASKRGETEVVDLIKKYLKKNKLNTEYLGRESAWFDAGTFENLEKASLFIKNIEERQGCKIACLEEIAFKNKWIKQNDIKKSVKFYGNCNYAIYLMSLIKK